MVPRPTAAQQDRRVTDELARLLAAADTRVYDPPLFAGALRDPDLFVRRQAALLPARQGRAAPRVTIETERGRLVVELLPVEAPLTVAAFLTLADRRYFDGTTWHRGVPNFVVQDGDPRDLHRVRAGGRRGGGRARQDFSGGTHSERSPLNTCARFNC